MSAKHTPGPWEVNYTKFSEVRSTHGALIAKCQKLDGLTGLQANARLIAAAPELLEFAREFLADYMSEDGLGSMKHYANKAHAAIAKATGEQA